MTHEGIKDEIATRVITNLRAQGARGFLSFAFGDTFMSQIMKSLSQKA